MYSRFTVNTDGLARLTDWFYSLTEGYDCLLDYYDSGDIIFEEHKSSIKKKLDNCIDYNTGIIDGELLEKELFREIEADIFLSHSHLDRQLAISFAGFLKEVFKLNVFIDSCVWDYAENILKEINERYNVIRKDKEKNRITYSYSDANYAASQIYLMLNSAINNMIDKTECFMFFDTDYSCFYINKKDREAKTFSPWIYSENKMANTIRKSTPLRFQQLPKQSISESYGMKLKISHPINLKNFFDLNSSDIQEWIEKYHDSESTNALDDLYKLKGII